MTIAVIGLDLAKSVFQAHAVDESGGTVLVKKPHRKQILPFFSKLPPCLIGVEACATAHHWARALSAMGHEVKLMPPSYVKAYVKRGKSDALDAEARLARPCSVARCASCRQRRSSSRQSSWPIGPGRFSCASAQWRRTRSGPI